MPVNSADLFITFENRVKELTEKRNYKKLEEWQNQYQHHIEKLQPIINFVSLIRNKKYWVFNHKNFTPNTWSHTHKPIPFDFIVYHPHVGNAIPTLTIFNPIEITIHYDDNENIYIINQSTNECPLREMIKSTYTQTQLDDLLLDLNNFLSHYCELNVPLGENPNKVSNKT